MGEAKPQYEVFLRVAARLQILEDLQDQLDAIAEGVVEAQTFRRALISLLDENWTVIQIGSAGIEGEELERIRERPPLSPEQRRSLLAEKYRIGNSYFIPHSEASAQEILSNGIESHLEDKDFVDWHPDDVLFVPLHGRQGEILGTLSVDDPNDGRRPTATSLRMLELFAREAAVTIETSMLNTELSRVRMYLETLIESIPDGIITLDREGNVVLFNGGACRITGYTADEIMGQPVTKLYASEQQAKEVMFTLRSKSEEGERGLLAGKEIMLKTKSGKEIPGSLSASIMLDENGREIGTAGVCKDLRPIRKLEQKLIKAEKIATVGEVATLLSHEVNNHLTAISASAELARSFFAKPAVQEALAAAGLEAELKREQERIETIRSEAHDISNLTEKLQVMGKGREYETTTYVEGVSMIDIDQSLEKMAKNREIRILVADDKLYIRQSLRELFDADGFLVDDVENGEQALACLRRLKYDLLVTDIKMPGLNGYQVAEGALDLQPKLPVLLITAFGYDPDHSAVRAQRSPNVAGVLYKPFDLGKLKTAVKDILARDSS